MHLIGMLFSIALLWLLFTGPAAAGDYCGSDCITSEDFDDATSGGADGVGTLPAGWSNVAGENSGDGCFGDPCHQWWVNDSFGNAGETAPTIQVEVDHTDGLGNYLFVASQGNDNDSVQLLTPTFTLSASGEPYATFFVWSDYTGGTPANANTLFVDIMDSAGTTVEQSAVVEIGDTDISHWRPAWVDLDGVGAGTYRLRFRWESTFDQNDEAGEHDIAIDDFAVVADRNAAATTGATIEQTYYLPAPEDDILDFLDVVNGSAADPVETYTAISIARDNAIIYVDEHEDATSYESDITNPSQTFGNTANGPAPITTSTQTWGDGYPQNGYPPGHPDDLLDLGDIIILREPIVATATLDSILDYDARDKLASTDEIAITRAFWASSDETLNAGALELFPTSRWGTAFEIPIGHDINPGDMVGSQSCNTSQSSADNPFQEVALFIMADTDGTEVTVDRDGPGGIGADAPIDLDEGESVFVGFNQTVNVGATVDVTGGSGSIQVHAFTADEDTSFGSRFYTLVPRDQWSDNYFAPFDSSARGSGELVIYNPNGSAVDVDIFTGANPGTAVTTLNIAAGDYDNFEMPVTTALDASNGGNATRVQTQGGEEIYVLAVMDSCDRDHDWGGALLPDDLLTSAILIPLGFGNDPTNTATGNHSPVWVTASADTTLYVDFDGDFVPDLVDLNGDGDTNDVVDGIDESSSDDGMEVTELQLLRIHDLDQDQSGTLVFSLSGGPDSDGTGFDGTNQSQFLQGATIAGGWGQDSFDDTPVASPAIDVGTAFAPITFPENLPVTLSSFRSRAKGRSVDFRWRTASETFTVGFNFWGKLEGEWRRLNDEMYFNRVTDSIAPQRYRERVRRPRGHLEAVGISSVDTDGSEHFFGPFEPGRRYGSEATPEPIPWESIRTEMDERLRDKGYRKIRGRWRKHWRKHWRFDGDSLRDWRDQFDPLILETEERGIHRLTHGDLMAAGVDLRNVPVDEIAITYKGEPIPRLVRGSGRRFLRGNLFGKRGYIDFYADAVAEEDKRYTRTNVYQLVIDRGKALRPGTVRRRPDPSEAPRYYMESVQRDENRWYGLNMPAAEPWYEHRLLGRDGGSNGEAEVSLALNNLVSDAAGASLRLGLSGISFFTGSTPDHQVNVYLNGGDNPVAQLTEDGIVDWQVQIPLGIGDLQEGENVIRLEVPGVRGYPFDLVYGDTYAVDYPRAFEAVDNALSFRGAAPSFMVKGFSSRNIVAYAVDGRNLARLRVETERRRGDVSAMFPGIAAGEARYWVSAAGELPSPAVVGAVEPMDLVNPGADYIVIAHPNFIDRLRNTPDFLAAKQSQGYTSKVVNVQDVYMQYGHGMPLPGAIRDYLRAQDQVQPIQHVLLVGGATSDPLNYSGSNSVDFIPTMFIKTGEIIYQTPSDGTMVDIHDKKGEPVQDGVPDLSVGRWPVRTGAELDAIIAKTLRYQQTMANRRSALLVADGTDDRFPPFSSQTENIAARLATPGTPPVPWSDISRVFVDDFPSVSAAREALKQGLEAGHAMTLYSGHGSPSGWSFQGLLDWQAAQSLNNADNPSLVGTMSCYTSYFVSPTTDTVGHQLLLAGEQGAAVIHGAATLSGFSQNEDMLSRITSAMISGQTTGEAVLSARKALGPAHSAVISNWSLLGDPSVGVQP